MVLQRTLVFNSTNINHCNLRVFSIMLFFLYVYNGIEKKIFGLTLTYLSQTYARHSMVHTWFLIVS